MVHVVGGYNRTVADYMYMYDCMQDTKVHVAGDYCLYCNSGTSTCGHHWEPSNCPDCRGVLNSGVVLYRITTIETSKCPY